MKRWTIWAVLAVLGLVLGAPRAFAEDKTVAIIEFQGDAKLADSARDAVVQGLADWYSIASENRVNRQLKRMGVEEISELDEDEEFAELASNISADAIIEGEVVKKGRSTVLELRVRWSETGAVLEQTSVELSRGKRLDKKSREEVGNEALNLMTKFDSAREREKKAGKGKAGKGKTGKGKGKGGKGAATDEDTEEAESDGEESNEAGADEDAEGSEGTDEEEEGSGTEELQPDEDKAPSRAKSTSDGKSASSLGWAGLGLSIWRRGLSFTAAEGGMPLGYSTGTPAAGARLEGEVYPLSSNSNKLLSGIGVGLLVDRTLAMKTEVGMESYGTAAMRLGAGLRYLYALGEGPTAMAIKGSLGYGMLSFGIDSGMTELAVPDVAYSFIEAGAGVIFPIDPTIAITGNLTYMQILSKGEIAETGSYGPGGALAFGIDLGGQYKVMPNVLVRGGLYYTRVGLSFNTTTAGATSAADSYLGAFAAGAFVF